MNLSDSAKLLRNYAEHGDETAFRELVERYVDLVYSTAVRRVGGDVNLAQDVTQRVFADLALKARTLRQLEHLGGWLHRHTGFIASNMVRGERRRQIREQEAAQMNAISESPDSLWQELEPMLDDTIEQLEPPDRQAILLRFFERRDFRSLGNALGISDDTAQKRVSRAIEKLRSLLIQRGVTLSVVLLSALLAGRVINAAPAGLAANAAKFALAGASAGGGLAAILTKISESVAFKLSLGGIVIAAALWFARQHSSIAQPVHEQTNTISAVDGVTNSPPASNPLAKTAWPAANTNATGRLLTVNVVAADSGKPIPDVEFDYWLWTNGICDHMKPLYATRLGVCKVPVPDNTTELTLVSQRDGFADTLLDWHAASGDQIPAQYTLRAARALSVGGTVADPDGNPVAGAQVGFNNMPDPNTQTRPQSDDFGWPFWVFTTSDSQGRWEINRMGKEALKTVTGNATEPNFVNAPSIAPGRQSDVLIQLLAGKYVFKLGHAVVVQGIVKDADGKPLPNAQVRVGQTATPGSREGTSQADGTFSIVGCAPGTNVITAQADGFAANALPVNLTDGAGPFELVLHPGKLLELRVADEDGNPVPDANVSYDTWQSSSSDWKMPLQVDFHGHTDADGRLQWDSAPDGLLSFNISADGYMVNGDYQFSADGTEHVATLVPALTISGTVTDATTGQPVPKFRIIAGHPNDDSSTEATNVSWSTLERFWLSFSDGSFKYRWQEPPIRNADRDPLFAFKFEADGYAPLITRVIHASERNVRLDVALPPAPSTQVTVLLPDNEPAGAADIGLASPGARLSLVPGGLSHDNLQSGGSLLQTDNAGQFTLPLDPSITKIIATSSQGYAEATPAELAGNPVMQLQPWGQLNGILLTNGQPAAGSTLSFQYNQQKADTISFDTFKFRTQTDNAGHFTFAQVPPGNYRVMLLFTFPGGWTSGPSQPVTIEPGGTTTVTIDETNMTPTSVNQ
ncbi:MAG TPA: sigma-70 family RNA polymerase sigma factor [Candidatus Sulfotelmatobacter sp.]|nr:sigma-70 family RNA polymerase sigma factor [Candidatus Sulfotelmatobacter sp.]